MGHSVCCVVNCRNTGRNSHFKFYTFPTALWRLDQRYKWIAAVKRINFDGSPWTPRQYDAICSEHFVGGKKADVQASPSYVPTIFPKIYRQMKVNNSQDARPGLSRPQPITPVSDHSNSPKEIDPLFIDQCRFCGEFSDICVAVSGDTPYLAGNKTTLVLNDTSLQLDFNDDSLPETVCPDCDLKLRQFSDFVQAVKAAQETLIATDNTIETVIVKTECDSVVEVNHDEVTESPVKAVNKAVKKRVATKKSDKIDKAAQETLIATDNTIETVVVKTECDSVVEVNHDEVTESPVKAVNKAVKKRVATKKSDKIDIPKYRTADSLDTVVGEHITPNKGDAAETAEHRIANVDKLSLVEIRFANKRKIWKTSISKNLKKPKISEECEYVSIDIKENPIVKRNEEITNAIKSIKLCY